MRCDHEDKAHIGGDQIQVKVVTDHDPYEKKFFMQSHVLLAENEELLFLAAKAGSFAPGMFSIGKPCLLRSFQPAFNDLAD